MTRPRQFDAEAVRERVADVFTAHGYRGTSVSMLTKAAGLGKQSLYNSFGDKQALYLQALDCAHARMSDVRAAIDQAPNGRAAVEAFFAGLLVVCTDPDPSVHACIVSAGLLEGMADEAVSDTLRQKWRATEAMLRSAIDRGRRDGSIRRDPGPAELARLLMTLMSGLRLAARAGNSLRQLQATTRLVLQTLAPPE